MGNFCSLGCDKQRPTKLRSCNSKDDIPFNTGLFIQENHYSFTSIYEISPKSLGYGSYGEVYLCEHKRTKEKRAVKIIEKQFLSKSMIQKKTVLNEVDILKTLDHPNVLKIFEYFEDDKNYYIVMEFCSGGDLFDELELVKNLDEPNTANIIAQILSGLAYIHNRQIVHRDIKLENILICSKDNEIHIKIIDFNISTFNKGKKKLSKFTGTSYYIAPEVINESYDEKCDLWSCGVIMHFLLSGTFPFNGVSRDEVFEKILNSKLNLKEAKWSNISNPAKDLLRHLLDKNPKTRLTANQALSHPWVSPVFESQVDKKFFKRTLTRMLSITKKPKLKELFETFLLGQVQKNDPKIKLYEKVFLELDADRNGVISKQEITLLLEPVMPLELASKEAERIMKIIDNDQSGEIDFSEFLRSALEEDSYVSKENLRKGFYYFDKNHSDTIDKNELMSWLAEGAIIPMAIIEELINEADRNNDGVIDFEEFENLLLEKIENEENLSCDSDTE